MQLMFQKLLQMIEREEKCVRLKKVITLKTDLLKKTKAREFSMVRLNHFSISENVLMNAKKFKKHFLPMHFLN